MSINVVQYNILCPKLATSKTFNQTEKQYLDPEYRFAKIWEKLLNFISEDSIICLQEIPESWVGKLHDKFSEVGYHMFYSLYGDLYNDCMGVGICYPGHKYQSSCSKIVNIGQELPKEDVKKSNVVTKFLCWVSKSFDKWYQGDTSLSYAKKKRNRMLLMKFINKETHEKFSIATYHMPSAFK